MASPALKFLGFSIADPFAKLRRKFGCDAEGDYIPFALYDGYRTPAERSGNPNVLEMEDLLVTVTMNSRVGAIAARSFWDGIEGCRPWWAECNGLLAKLLPELDFADASDEQLEVVHRLFNILCALSGIKIAVAGKILCRKRPRFAPMLDSVVLPLACLLDMQSEGGTLASSLRWAEWHDVGRALRFFRHACREGRQQLDRLCQSFRTLPGNPELAPLRALESLLWWEATQEPKGANPTIEHCRNFMEANS